MMHVLEMPQLASVFNFSMTRYTQVTKGNLSFKTICFESTKNIIAPAVLCEELL
jgi:hypothetical protein